MPDVTLCPNCDAPVQPGWKVCPLCTHALGQRPITAIRTDAERTPASAGQRKKHRWNEPILAIVPNIEKDVKTDNTVMGVVLLTLGILGIVGIILYVLNSRSPTEISINGIIGVAITVIVVIMVGSVLTTQHSKPGVSTVVGIFSGLTTGCLIAMIVVMVVLASILHSCATCNITK
jgi:hypothetical protein